MTAYTPSVIFLAVLQSAAGARRLSSSILGAHLPSFSAAGGHASSADRGSSANCTTFFYQQNLDHFGSLPGPDGSTTFNQRYFVCNPPASSHAPAANDKPLFFYCGNEADVELYVNNTGLMWENAGKFGATMVFAEHRYFGKSLPEFVPQTGVPPPLNALTFLSAEQALADFATLIDFLRKDEGFDAVVAFGGSYGGMLASWLRIKYPWSVDGVIAGSAPILSFIDTGFDYGSYGQKVTFDASAAGGSTDLCETQIRQAWQEVFKLGESSQGCASLNQVFRLCPNSQVGNSDDALELAYWLQSAFDYMSMGSYPYPSSYILNGAAVLPAYPMRAACSGDIGTKKLSRQQLLAALRDAAAIFYNSSKVKCYDTHGSANNATETDALLWDYLFCSGILQPSSRNGKSDMFWPQPFDLNQTVKGCQAQWGLSAEAVRPYSPAIRWGGVRLDTTSNIVFSNGQLDPWMPGGVTKNVSESVVAIVIHGVGHHMDLMFSDPLDPPSVIQARQIEVEHISKWIKGATVAAAAAPAETN